MPASAGESQWILQGLNRLENRIEKLDERIQRLERKVWIAVGVVIAVGFTLSVLQFFLGGYEISFTPRP